jgi:hypothetical protein
MLCTYQEGTNVKVHHQTIPTYSLQKEKEEGNKEKETDRQTEVKLSL